MQVFNDFVNLTEPTAVALGLFDSVHQGHKAVILKAVEGKIDGLKPIIVTFKTDVCAPRKKQNVKYIMQDKTKLELIEKIGVEFVVNPQFELLRDIEPEDFVEKVLIGKLCARRVCCGYDFKFGKNARGDIKLLEKLCAQHGIELAVVPPVMQNSVIISSTLIRKLLELGDIERVNEMLGYNYFIDFEVVEGNKIGRTIGTPTANQIFPQGVLVPKYGVYASYAYVDGVQYNAVTNVGIKPTVSKTQMLPLAETHIMDFDGNLYGRCIKVELVDYIRDERRFESVEVLKQNIAIDLKKATNVLNYKKF